MFLALGHLANLKLVDLVVWLSVRKSGKYPGGSSRGEAIAGLAEISA